MTTEPTLAEAVGRLTNALPHIHGGIVESATIVAKEDLRTVLTALSARQALPSREEVCALVAFHVRQINRVVADGMHEGPAINDAADAILSLIQGERE